MKQILRTIFCVWLAFLVQTGLAENRFLFIVDTSAGMKDRAREVNRAIEEMIVTRVNNEVRRGDTFAIWTFNEEVFKGRFPLQAWQPGNSVEIADETIKFLKSQRYEKKARTEKVAAEIASVAEGSESITIFIFTDGMSALNGTPFDREVNSVFAQHRDELNRTKIPFVVALRGREGKLVSFSMNSTAGPILIPGLPATEMVKEPQLDPKLKSELSKAVQAVFDTNATPRAQSKTVVPAKKLPKVKANPEVKKVEAKPLEATVVTNVEVKPASTPLPAPRPEIKTVQPPEIAPAPTTESKPASQKPIQTVTENKQPDLKPPTTTPTNSVRPVVPLEPAPTISPSPASDKPKRDFSPAINDAILGTTQTLATTQTFTAAQSKSTAAPITNAGSPLSTPLAISTPSPAFSRSKGMLIAAGCFIVAALALGLMALRRSRASNQGSLITQSLDSQRPPEEKR